MLLLPDPKFLEILIIKVILYILKSRELVAVVKNTKIVVESSRFYKGLRGIGF